MFEYVALAPVIENIAAAPAVILPVPSQQLPPVFSTANVVIDVNFDITDLVSPQFSSTAVEASAPTELGYNQFYQEQMMQNIIENSAVQEQVNVPEILWLLSGYRNNLSKPSM